MLSPEDMRIPGTVQLTDADGRINVKHAGNTDVILIPTPTDDPEDPLNWTPRQKALSTFCTLSTNQAYCHMLKPRANEMHQSLPFRAEDIGSLLRPAELLQLRESVAAGERAQQDLTDAENRYIKDIVRLQQDLRFQAITDGEYRRQVYWGDFFTNLDGLQDVTVNEQSIHILRDYVPDFKLFTDAGAKGAKTTLCSGKIKHVRSTFVESFEYLKGLVRPEQVKNINMAMGSPHWFHFRYRPGCAYPSDVYSCDTEYYHDVAAAYQAELEAVYAVGMRNLQIDDPTFAFDEVIDEYIALVNDCINLLPADVHVGLHLCRGNFMSRHWATGVYERIAKKIFKQAKVDTFLLEFDTDRSGGLEPLMELPSNKHLVLGLVTTKFPQLEHSDVLKRRVWEAARFMAEGSGQNEINALKRISLSPQCGVRQREYWK
ncbi:uncharacterized protein A1O5_09181 [Cladophialophora psammophila CBS 110553]|uniref:Cobalamin-independent methionine synthase MetE C-terminal/archaeal domain-containing protein n=1 Tax=Cladophialophora psammophila CBS 110553 TaxID=1182543 RepID=W9WS84_9EURO|nr:uncharacterized protein A1O5_09181 [Cladophialophora psammophila CBS 110553]EXJ67835.1 hypothetical protein A1O5_09181 [Cladophialophora psammophila CBS 110553]